ncbi:uncharacterized protein BDR25DRAFT_70507 [Lindgomyces ingoldianus]|uniref:Uncharacterized protein n=1 Tax=Lindgomyces ingoldianus TaxID=673940 RepID=A0ACB6QKA0_9PLEO|nr:uncharacterized protein BDR25DRAFT_70507 [Lindgomyces ingoldianus]KAF2467297.1 hypothetical protein BDR25DRAFT_70507 [Lindgomyces ingoldianus]
MRSFKQKVLTAVAWALPALSAALPAVQGHDHALIRTDGKQPILELDLQESYAQATFSVPCAGCLGQDDTGHDDDSLILSFKTHSSKKPCGASNITLNGIYLPQEWNGDLASGSGSFRGVPDIQENAWFLQHDLDLEWQSACLYGNETATEENANDAAQVLTVTIKGIDGKVLNRPSGFTVSFKQLSPPELLRLEATPNRSASNKEQAETWREPPPHLRLILSPPENVHFKSSDIPGQLSLEDEIRELRILQAEVQELHEVIKEKRKHIKSQLKKEAQSLKEELQECDSVTCVIKAIAHKAHGAWRIIYIRFRPLHHHHGHEMGRPDEQDPYDRVWRAGNHNQAPEANVESVPPPPPHGPPHPPHHGPPPPPPPHHKPGHHPPPPPPPPRHHGPPEPPYFLAIKIIAGVLCCGCLFAVIRHRCSSPRTRTERAALREERANERAYRRAARQHAWRKWWRRNWRDQDRIDDYEEKRALIQEQESVLEDAMQEEIRQLREAHGVVRSIVQAEEGRGVYPRCNTAHMHMHIPCHCHAHAHVPSPNYSPVSSAYTSSSLPSLPSRPLSRTNSLPDYRSDTSTEPPAYEEDEDMSDVVVNGFRQYTPSTSSGSTRWTPESSVIDVSPRPSAETLRYAGTGGETRDADQFAETTETNFGNAKN